jgi:hypothetical protein
MGSNPIIGTSEKAFHEEKPTNTARSADSAYSRIKTRGLPANLPSELVTDELQMSPATFVTNRLGAFSGSAFLGTAGYL